MSAFTLTLDTHAPVVDLTGRQLVQNDHLSVALATNEPGVAAAWAIPPSGPPIPGTLTPGHAVFDLGGEFWPVGGQIQVDSIDAVGNTATRLFDWATAPYFTLNLDTTPPVLTLLNTSILQGTSVTLTYSLNEGQALSATAVVDGNTLTGTVTSSEIQFLIPGQTWINGRVTVNVIDDVGNAEALLLVVSQGPAIDRTWQWQPVIEYNDYVRAGWTRR